MVFSWNFHVEVEISLFSLLIEKSLRFAVHVASQAGGAGPCIASLSHLGAAFPGGTGVTLPSYRGPLAMLLWLVKYNLGASWEGSFHSRFQTGPPLLNVPLTPS